MSAYRIYKLVVNTVWGLAIAGFLALCLVAMKTKEAGHCKGLLIHLAAGKGQMFIDETEIKSIIQTALGGNISRPLKAVDLKKLESRLTEEIWISDAQLYLDAENWLHAHIRERIPVARIFDVLGNSYYLDSAAHILPLSNTDRADVPVFTQMPVNNQRLPEAFDKTANAVIAIARQLERDPFWKAQAAQIVVMPDGRFELHPAVGYHTVDLGDSSDMEDKLLRLKLFYTTVFSKTPLRHYKKLTVAFQHQVVALKGEDSVQHTGATRAVEIFREMVEKNRHEVNAAAIESEKDKGRILQDADQPVSVPVTPPGSYQLQLSDSNFIKPKAILPVKTYIN